MIYFATYFFSKKYGVGSLRSRSLYKKCKDIKKNEELFINHVEDSKINPFIWGILVLFDVIKKRPDTIYISAGPFVSLLPIVICKMFIKTKLIIDFRDPWSINIKNNYGLTGNVSKMKLKVAITLEKLFFHLADYIIVCTQGMYNYYSSLATKNKSKLKLIPNGHEIDENNFKMRNKAFLIRKSKLRIICLGKFVSYNPEMATNVFDIIEEMSKKGCQTELIFIGSDKRESIEKYIHGNKNLKIIFYDRLPYEKAVSIASDCDIGILSVRDQNVEYGTKIFDYIGLGIPVINVFNEKKEFYKKFHRCFLDVNFQMDNNYAKEFSREKSNKAIINLF